MAAGEDGAEQVFDDGVLSDDASADGVGEGTSGGREAREERDVVGGVGRRQLSDGRTVQCAEATATAEAARGASAGGAAATAGAAAWTTNSLRRTTGWLLLRSSATTA